MGQRHQAFAIAQIIPYGKTKPQYRCIAAWHHQWCYGRLPLHATHRLTTLLKQKDNAEIVRHEIASINGKFGTFGKRPEIPDVPCPYIGFLLCQAFSTNLEITSDKDSTAYYSGVSFANNHLDAGMGSTEGDNNDGISVIDVTDPSNPAYCFVSIYGLEGGGDVPELAPLSAEQYARSYYPEDSSPPEVEADVVATIAKLDDVRLLTLQALAEAWPTEYGAVAKPESIDEAVMPDEDSASRVPTLASITLTSAVDHALISGDTAELETLIWMPDKTAAIGSALREKSPFPDSGLSLLGQYLKYDSKGDVPNVDLVGFSLNPDQTATIVSQFEQVDTLKLPSISSIDTVRKTLTSLPRVRRLHLLDSNITSEELGLLLRNEPALFYHLEELVHPLMFDNDTEHHVNAFSCLQRERHSIMGGMGLAIASLPLLNPPQVFQALVDIFTAITANKMGAMGLSMTALVPQVAMGTAPRPAGEPWGQRHVSSFPKVCANALFGEGWLFVFTLTDGYSGRFVYYGFTKVNRKVLERNMKKAAQKQSKKDGEEAHEEEEEASDVNHVVCGLAGFLEIMKEEGRPLPSPQVTKQLETIFAKLEEQGTRVIVPSDVEEMVLSGRRGF